MTAPIEQRKTGTTLVGVVAKDGIVIAADRRASLGGRIVAKKDTHKVLQITDDLVLATAGNVSDIQMNIKVIKAQLKLLELRRGKKASTTEAANLLSNMLFGNIRRSYIFPSIAAFLLGGRDEEGVHLYQADPDGTLVKHEDYIADGSGMFFALGSLESNYKPNMNMNDAVKLAIQAVQAAIERDTASGNGIDVMTITKNGVEHVYQKQLSMSLQ